MSNLSATPVAQQMSVLLIDSDQEFLKQGCAAIAADGLHARGVNDLAAARSILADQTPEVLVAELDLLAKNGSDPLAKLRARAPQTPLILVSSGPPDSRFDAYSRTHDVYGYHDRNQGSTSLRLWVGAATASARNRDQLERSRRGLRKVLDGVPHLHKIQSMDEVLESIMTQVGRLIGGRDAFVSARASDPVGKPPIQGISELRQTLDDYIVGVAKSEAYPRGERVDRLASLPADLLTRAVEEGEHIIEDRHAILPLALAEHVLGLAYVERPRAGERNVDLLRAFSTQAAAAIRSAALYDLATRDSTTRAYRKAFTLERLRETVKLGWRKGFPVTVLMLDIDQFKALNDAYGHVTGDRALRHLVEILKANVRDSDIVGRFGGDEFLVVLIDANQQGADIVAERLVQALLSERSRPWPGDVPPVKTSMGLATLEPGEEGYLKLGFPNFPLVVETLVAEADAAMYQARREASGMIAGRSFTWTDFLKG